jgi:hypothetical protein
MALKLKPTWAELRSTLLVIIGVAITILFTMASVSIWRSEYGRGGLFLILGAALSFAFFRKIKASLLMIGFIWMMVNAGLTLLFHPSVLGALITVGSGIGIVVLGRWMAGQPRLG